MYKVTEAPPEHPARTFSAGGVDTASAFSEAWIPVICKRQEATGGGGAGPSDDALLKASGAVTVRTGRDGSSSRCSSTSHVKVEAPCKHDDGLGIGPR